MIMASIYTYSDEKTYLWEVAYDHPAYDTSVTLKAETPEELLLKIAEELNIGIEIRPKSYCGAV